MLRIRNLTSLEGNMDADQTDVLHRFPYALYANFGIEPQLGYHHFPSNPFQFITFYHLTVPRYQTLKYHIVVK